MQMVRNMHSNAFGNFNDPQKRAVVDQISLAQCGKRFDEPAKMPSLRRDADSVPSCPYARVRHTMSFPSAQLPVECNESQQPYLYLNQFDMADTQFTFIAVLILFPEKFGAKYANDEDLAGFAHFWRCVGIVFLLCIITCQLNLFSDPRVPPRRSRPFQLLQ